VAVKVFKGGVSPDGHMRDEVDIACALDHPNLTRRASPLLVTGAGVVRRLLALGQAGRAEQTRGVR
jgi:hypothetical protein